MQANTSLDRIWQLTKEIEQAMAVGEFQEAARLAGERSPLVMSLSAQQSPEALETLETLKAVIEIDSMIFANAQTAQRELTAEYTEAMRATRGVNQYQRVAHL
jgi:hypothetical protein